MKRLAEEPSVRIRVVAYDMAMSAEAQAELYSTTGIISVSKVPRARGGQLKFGKIDRVVKFKLLDGTEQEVDVFTVDGAAGVVFPVDGEQFIVPLRTTRRFARSKTFYTEYEIPDSEEVPIRLRRAKTLFGVRRGDPDNVALFKIWRFFPEPWKEFRALFARRQDAESLNEDYQRRLPNRRSRSWTEQGQQLDLANFAIFTNLRALASYRHRTADPPVEDAA